MTLTRSGLLWIGLSMSVAGCKFADLGPVDPDAIASTDGDTTADAAIDAPVACTANAIVCDDASGVYTECSSAGIVALEMHCPLGCAPAMEKCLDIDPSNGLAMYLDMAATAPDLALHDTTLIDTFTGSILVAGEAIVVPNFVANGIRVFVVRSLTVDGFAQVTNVYGNAPLGFVSDGDVMIRGLIDVSAQSDKGGAGGYWGGEQSSSLPCAGAWSGGQGSSGAGAAEAGASGGATNTLARLPGGPAAASVEPLHGGCEGGTTLGAGTSYGGGGGGGLQITSRTRIDITGSGAIDASGGGALHTSSATNFSGGGGGGGGNIVLEAPQVVLNGAAVVVSTKGGGA